jgi:hypothetical protein
LIDQNAADASRKLDRIVRVALENLPLWLKERLKFSKDNDSHIAFDLNGSGERTFYAGMNARGGSNDFLWVSEWGVIQYEDPKRSGRIRSGALPSARHGVTVVETTWAGGKGGDVWELLEPSLTGKADDWLVLFFPWWVDPRNVAPEAMLDETAEKYFAKIAPRLEREGIKLSDAQRRWWAKERRAQGIFMARENPTFLDECWSAPVQGAVYAEAIERAGPRGELLRCRWTAQTSCTRPGTWARLKTPSSGTSKSWGARCAVIDCDRHFEGTLTQRVAAMLAKGYSFGKHYLPHDAQQTERSGTTLATELHKAGLLGTVVVPRTHSVWVGINHVLEMFPALAFRSPQCDDGLAALTLRTARAGRAKARCRQTSRCTIGPAIRQTGSGSWPRRTGRGCGLSSTRPQRFGRIITAGRRSGAG